MSEIGGPEEPDRPAGGRHRAPASSVRRLLYRWVAPLMSVAVVAAVIVVLVEVRGHSSGSGPGPGVISAATTPPVLTPTASSTPTPTVALTHPPPTQLPTPQVTHHHRPAWRTAMAPVRVYNTTRITGLAHHVAAEVAAKGWTVPAVGNVRGVSPRTTLYYSADSHAAARHLAQEFSGIQRVRPNSEAQVSYHGLTLVLTADWHD